MFQAKAELTKFGLIEASDGFRLPDVTPYLPEVADNNISQHLWKVASDQVRQFFSNILIFPHYLLFLVLAPSGA